MTDHETSMTEGLPAFSEAPADESVDPDEGWQRLNSRMIWVDAIQSVLALSPAVIAVVFFDIAILSGNMTPFAVIAAIGVIGAINDAMRWVLTRYRVTETYVERRTGLFVRRYRSVKRDRIRNVDAHGKLRHRLAGLRIVTIGAGQSATSLESAFHLNAISKADAEELRRGLLGRKPIASADAEVAESGADPLATVDDDEADVFATLQPKWLLWNLFNIWAYLLAAGVLWGLFWLLSTINVNLFSWIGGLIGWSNLGTPSKVAAWVIGLTVIGVIGMAISFFTEHWNFQLARVPGVNGTTLRTRQGLFKTHEINRDDSRMRGVSIAQPLFWRWMKMADTTIITTGVNMWSPSSGAMILPRGPLSEAQRVTRLVLPGDEHPLEASPIRHPAAALRRRMIWATAIAVVLIAGAWWLTQNTGTPDWVVFAVAGTWPILLAFGVSTYLALGHVIDGQYFVTRHGLMSWQTSALQRKAISGVSVRQSLLQRRLGLATVTASTAAGWAGYKAKDLAASEAPTLASEAAPGLLGSFLDDIGA